jgi:putative transposase
MCRVLRVARSGYYAWRRCRESVRASENKRLMTVIRQLFEQSRETYGSPRIFHSLKKMGYTCGRHRVARLMRETKIQAVQRRAFRVTTVPGNQKAAPNLLQQQFRVSVPNRVWTSDITYIATKEGWLYLAVVLDMYSRRVVGWSMQEQLVDELVANAFNAAWNQRKPATGLIVHSDRGFQYAGQSFRRVLSNHACIQSMSATGNCYDNAVTETFFHSLKVELVYRKTFVSRNEARKSIFEYIESFYNRQRLHSTLGYKCPVEFEELSFAGRG